MPDARLVELIGEIQDDFPGYGYRRVTHELRRRGVALNDKRVSRVMKARQGVRPRRRSLLQFERSLEELHYIIEGSLAELRIGLDMYHTTLAGVGGWILVFTATVKRVEEMYRAWEHTDR